MSFDIHQLAQLDKWDENAFEEYSNTLVELFLQSEEGQTHLEQFPEADAGFWASQLMHYGYNYLGITLPQMSKADVEEIITELFPRKISLLSPEDAEDAIPELLAFWKYLKRKYALQQANAVLRFLRKIAPDFVNILNDPSKFGMAKSFVMIGQSAGFDMTKKEDIDEFMHLYNATIAAEGKLGRALGTSDEKKKQPGKRNESRNERQPKQPEKEDAKGRSGSSKCREPNTARN